MRHLKLYYEGSILLTLLHDAFEKNVGVDATGAGGHAHDSSSGPGMALEKARKQFGIQSVIFENFAGNSPLFG